jgi:hypothetical protein
MAEKGQWVQIHSIVLNPGERAPQVPDDTKKTPLVMWVKGYLNHDAEIGAECEITTVTGRVARGVLDGCEPAYIHNFGSYVPELAVVRDQVKTLLFGGGA